MDKSRVYKELFKMIEDGQHKINYDYNFKLYISAVESVLAISEDFKGVKFEDLKVKSQTREVVELRRCFFVKAKEIFDEKISLKKIGSVFGKDHATVLHALRTHQNLIETDPQYKGRYLEFSEKVNEKFNLTDKKVSAERVVDFLESQKSPLLEDRNEFDKMIVFIKKHALREYVIDKVILERIMKKVKMASY